MKANKSYCNWFILLTISLFLLIVTYLSTEIQIIFQDTVKNLKIYNVDENTTKMRVVKITNNYPFDISVFYEESNLDGSFLTNLGPDKSFQVSTVNGNTLYATEPDEFERLSTILIRPESDHYSFVAVVEHESMNRINQEVKIGTGTTTLIDSKPRSTTDDVINNLEYKLNVEHRERSHPAVHPLSYHEKASTATSIKFRSLSGKRINLWYDDGAEGTLQAHLSPGQETTTNSYVGHVFYATYMDNKDVEISRFRVNSDQVLYVINDDEYPAPEAIIEQSRREEDFMIEYYNRTGIHWRHYFGKDGPRDPPESFMWPGENVGDVHQVTSTAGYWTCDTKDHCGPSKEPITFDIEVISKTPRAFIITNFLNDVEAAEIMDLAQPRLHLSQVGDVSAGIFESKTRTSSNSWIPRTSSYIIENLYLRAAHLLRIPPTRLYSNSEDLQVVHYEKGQKYDAHHDWGVSGYPESRFLTLLMYLNNPASPKAGGYTSFPKDGKGGGIKVHPGKGNAVLFYNLLEDGNGDDLALHSALPCIEGEKWLANFWVWDKKKR